MDTATISAVITSALDYAYAQNSNFAHGIARDNLESAMQAAVAAVIPSELQLGTTQPDFEAIYLRMVQELQTDTTWYDVIQSGTGQTLLRNICSGIAYALFSVERALQESFLHSAQSPNSVYSAARMLGVRPQRRLPASVTVRLTKPDDGNSLTLDKFTHFVINNTRFFNRNTISFNEFDLTLDVQLTQGVILSMTATAEGLPFEKIEFGSENGLISDQDVYVYIDSKEWLRKTEDGFHTFGKNEEAFYEDTLPNKNVEVQFGNKAFGKIPPAGSAIVIKWAETEGNNANYAISGLTVSLFEPPTGIVVDGITLGTIQYGMESLSVDFYKVMSPHIHASKKGAIRRADYRSVALQYPGVVDALFRGQAELNPGRRNWMNIVGATILMEDGSAMSSTTWNDFIRWMKNNKAIYQCEYLKMDPTVLTINVSANIYCRQNSNLTLIKNDLLSKITTTFAPRLNALGFSVYKTDVSDILDGTGTYSDYIEYCTDVLPNVDTIATALQWVKVNSVTLNMFYSTRNNYMGRLDLIPPTPTV